MAKKKRKKASDVKITEKQRQHGQSSIVSKDRKFEENKVANLTLSLTVLNDCVAGSSGIRRTGGLNLSEANERVISIHKDNADSLEIFDGESVLLLQVNVPSVSAPPPETTNPPKTMTITWDCSDHDALSSFPLSYPQFAAICKANVISPQKNITAQRKKSRNLKVGEASIRPNQLSQRLFESKESQENLLSPLQNTPRLIKDCVSSTPNGVGQGLEQATTPCVPISTPSPSNSQFSFARGGGGDSLIKSIKSPSNDEIKPKETLLDSDDREDDEIFHTPQKHYSNLSSPKSFRSSNSKQKKGRLKNHQEDKCDIVVLPMRKYGTLFSGYLWGNAVILAVRLIHPPDPSESLLSMLSKSTRVLERMIVACCHHQYFARNDIITTSFQGKRIRFEIVQAEAERSSTVAKREEEDSTRDNAEEERLTNFIAKMRIQDVEERPEEQQYNLTQKIEHDYGGIQSLLLDLKCKQSAMESTTDNGQRALYRITYNTKINFAFDQSELINGSPLLNEVHQTLHEANRSNATSSNHKKIVAGVDFILQQLHSLLIPPLLYPERFPRTGPIRAPKGVLLYGNSGCGKTLIAAQVALDLKFGIYRDNASQKGGLLYRTAKGIKSKRAVEVVTVHCADIQSCVSIVGNAEKQLLRIFEHAENRAIHEKVSTVLIFDDIHLICEKRGMGSSGGKGTDRVASTLLALLDGVGISGLNGNDGLPPSIDYLPAGNVVVLATTSNPALLDPALRRAGRLDEEVEIPIPDDKTRSDIFSFLIGSLKKNNVDLPDLVQSDYMSFAQMAKGFTGADCALCVKEAVREAVLQETRDNSLTPTNLQIFGKDLRNAIKVTRPSAIKSITVEVPKVPWSSIGGMDHVKEHLREAIELPMTHSKLFLDLCISPPRGVLLYGPPGCSKTLMARALATEGKMNFLAVKGPELLSKWLGESERALAALFRRARMASPCVIFFDEIDAIASKRGSGGSSGGGERMLSQLLTELDGVSMPIGSKVMRENSGKLIPRVVVVGATNRPDLLDDALIRPGRIDKMIYVGIPDQQSREAIFRVTLNGKACDPNINFHELANEGLTGGYSGAEIVAICRDAALHAIEESDIQQSATEPVIKMSHIKRSIGMVKRQITPDMLRFYDSFYSKTVRT